MTGDARFTRITSQNAQRPQWRRRVNKTKFERCTRITRVEQHSCETRRSWIAIRFTFTISETKRKERSERQTEEEEEPLPRRIHVARGFDTQSRQSFTRTLLGVDYDGGGRHEPQLSTVARHHQRSVLVVERRYDLVLCAVRLRRAHRPARLLRRVGAVGCGTRLSCGAGLLYDAARRIHAPRHAIILRHHCWT